MKIAVAGKNKISIEIVNYILTVLKFPKKQIAIIPNQDDKGIDTWQRSLKKYAISNDIEIVQLSSLYDLPDLIFLSAEYDKIIKPELFKSDALFNLHFSLLPKYKGSYTSTLPILNGESESGVTLHKIDSGIDTGPIIDQIHFQIPIQYTAEDLYIDYMKHAFILFRNAISSLMENKYAIRKQDALGSTYYSRKSIDYNIIIIDYRKTSYQIHNQIRAFIFPYYQYPNIHGTKIVKSFLTNTSIKPGYFEDAGTSFIISGIDGYEIRAQKLIENAMGPTATRQLSDDYSAK